MNPIEKMTLREIIRSRPMGVGILEELTDGAFWGRLDASVADFCRDAGLDMKDLQHRFGSLPVNLDRQDWRELPLYFLVDHLTANHREFRARDLPEVHRLLEDLRMAGRARRIDGVMRRVQGFPPRFQLAYGGRRRIHLSQDPPHRG
jgi:hypothetical protein